MPLRQPRTSPRQWQAYRTPAPVGSASTILARSFLVHFREASYPPPHQKSVIALRPTGADFAFCPIAEQTIELHLGNAVALARVLLQAAAIDDRDVAAFVADEARPLQGARRSRNAGRLHPQHHGQELLRSMK